MKKLRGGYKPHPSSEFHYLTPDIISEIYVFLLSIGPSFPRRLTQICYPEDLWFMIRIQSGNGRKYSRLRVSTISAARWNFMLRCQQTWSIITNRWGSARSATSSLPWRWTFNSPVHKITYLHSFEVSPCSYLSINKGFVKSNWSVDTGTGLHGIVTLTTPKRIGPLGNK